MIISNVNYGQEITITSFNDNRDQVDLKSHVVLLSAQEDLRVLQKFREKYPDLHFCIIEPVRYQDKLINFESDNVVCNVTTILNDNPYMWKDVLITNIRFPSYGSAHLLATNENCKSINRREGYRIHLGYVCSVKLGEEENLKATVMDVSEVGVCVIIEEKKAEKGDGITVTFTEPSNDTVYKLKAYVVRVEETERGLTKLGCKLINKSVDIRKLVTLKQKEQMARDKALQKPEAVPQEAEEAPQAVSEEETQATAE